MAAIISCNPMATPSWPIRLLFAVFGMSGSPASPSEQASSPGQLRIPSKQRSQSDCEQHIIPRCFFGQICRNGFGLVVLIKPMAFGVSMFPNPPHWSQSGSRQRRFVDALTEPLSGRCSGRWRISWCVPCFSPMLSFFPPQ